MRSGPGSHPAVPESAPAQNRPGTPGPHKYLKEMMKNKEKQEKKKEEGLYENPAECHRRSQGGQHKVECSSKEFRRTF